MRFTVLSPTSRLRASAVALSAAAIAACAFAAPAAAHPSHNGFSCTTVTVPVTLPNDTVSYRVVGDLCAEGRVAGKPLQITVAGFSYNSWYFNPTYRNAKYSYVRAAAASGFAVFNYDQLGTAGRSDIPPVASLSLLNQVEVLHQIVGKMRDGQATRTRFSKVVAVGHSLGGQEVMIAASRYPKDMDALVNIGYLRDSNPVGSAEIGAYRVPAAQTAKYAGATWTDGYLTTADGKRGFFHGTTSEQGMIDADEANKAVASSATAAQAGYLRTGANRTLTYAITAPVLDVTGRYDPLGCDDSVDALSCASTEKVYAREKPYFPNTCLTAVVVPEAGHDVGLHRGAQAYFGQVNRWISMALSGRHAVTHCR